jgi:hypothetical protein
MAAVCVRARRDMERKGADRTPEELADAFCRQARLRVEDLFERIRDNADVRTAQVARGLLDGRYRWLEEGIIPAPTRVESGEADRARRIAT